MAMKYLVLALVIGLVLWLTVGRKPRVRPPGRKTARPPELEGMVVCAHCGVHLPRSEALAGGGHSYCSAAHRDAGPRADA
jgi:uncharacterized protein